MRTDAWVLGAAGKMATGADDTMNIDELLVRVRHLLARAHRSVAHLGTYLTGYDHDDPHCSWCRPTEVDST